MNNDLMFSSNKDDWETPQKFFDELNEEFHFDLDAAATEKNKKCARYLKDAFTEEWIGDSVFCNPPYGRQMTGEFIARGVNQVKARNCHEIVFLVPARTDTRWFHKYCLGDMDVHEDVEIRFLKGRLKFEINGVPCKHAAPFPSMLVIYR